MFSSERGQSAVELALCLPFVAALLAIVIEVGCIAADQTRLWHAAREAARASAVDASRERVSAAARAGGLDPLEIDIEPEERYRIGGAPTTVELRYEPPTRVPVLGRLVPRKPLTAKATMRIEQP